MNRDNVYTLFGLALVVIGGFLLFAIAKTIFIFLLDNWVVILSLLFAIVAIGFYLLFKDDRYDLGHR